MVDFCGSREEALRTGVLLPYYSVEVEMQTGINNRKSNVAVMWVAIGKDAFVFLNGSDGFDDIVDLWVRRAFRHSEEV